MSINSKPIITQHLCFPPATTWNQWQRCWLVSNSMCVSHFHYFGDGSRGRDLWETMSLLHTPWARPGPQFSWVPSPRHTRDFPHFATCQNIATLRESKSNIERYNRDTHRGTKTGNGKYDANTKISQIASLYRRHYHLISTAFSQRHNDILARDCYLCDCNCRCCSCGMIRREILKSQGEPWSLPCSDYVTAFSTSLSTRHAFSYLLLLQGSV